MTLQQLEYIVAVYRTRHFAKAAEQCGVTQPTLSAMIQKLEAELDIRIFERSSQQVTPTPIGKMVVEQAWKVIQRANKLKDIVAEEGCNRPIPHRYSAHDSTIFVTTIFYRTTGSKPTTKLGGDRDENG